MVIIVVFLVESMWLMVVFSLCFVLVMMMIWLCSVGVVLGFEFKLVWVMVV